MLKSIAIKGLATIAAGAAIVVSTTHLLGGDRAGTIRASDLGAVSLASAQIGDIRPDTTAQHLPADALTPGKRLAPAKRAAVAPTRPPIDCAASLNAILMEGAMVRLAVTAPCDPDARVELRHEGLIFNLMTDADGAVSVDIPALSKIATFDAVIGENAPRTIAAIPDFDSYSRVALQWTGQSGLHIHALEFGADYGGDGHVWADAPGSSLRAVRARGGFIARLGDDSLPDGRMAEVYVFPVGMIQRGGTVRLSVEAEVNALSCGGAVEGQALQPGADGALMATHLTLEIPDCDAIGDILVLKNLLRDMKIASN